MFKQVAMPSLAWLRIVPEVETWLTAAFSALWVVPLVLTSKIGPGQQLLDKNYLLAITTFFIITGGGVTKELRLVAYLECLTV